MSRRRALMRLTGDRRGAALIEFAVAVPVLLVLFVGGYQLMDAISVYRKVTTTTRTLSDLTTQSTSTSMAGIQQILAASQQVMSPYSAANGTMRITQIKVDVTGTGKVDWSQGLNTTGYTKGTVIATSAVGLVPNTYLIYSEITYQYVPNIASGIIGQIPLKDTIYMSPRNSASVPCSDCP